MSGVSAHGMAAPPVENDAAWERMRLLADEFKVEQAARRASIVAVFAQVRRLPPGIHRGMDVMPLSPDRMGLADGPEWGA